jgi:photosystem II stability/assembly factor-like uncharacterized protein
MKPIFTLLLIISIMGLATAQWSSSNGPWKGSATCFTSLGDKIFAGTFNEGIYYSTNNGTRWHPSSMVGLTNPEIKCFFWSGENFYAGTSGGVYLSTDFGENWFAINTGLGGSVVSLLSYDNSLYAATGGGVFKTTDNGASWGSVSYNIYNIRSVILIDNIFYAATSQGVFKSIDGGYNWSSANVGLINQNVNTLYQSGNTIYAGSGYSPGAASLYRTTNQGTTWISSGLINRSVNTLITFQSHLYAGCNNGIYRSTDLGISWSGELGNTKKEFVAFYPLAANLLGGSTSGIFISSHGGTIWDQVGYNSMYIQGITSNINELWATAVHDMVYYSSNNGISWIKRSNELPAEYRYLSISSFDTLTYVSFINNNLSRTGVFYTSDDGNSWNQSMYFTTTGSIQCLKEYNDVLFMGFYPKTGQYGLYCLGAPFIGYQFYNVGVTDIEDGANYLYAATRNGIFRSADSGATWVNKGIQGHAVAPYGTDLFVADDRIYYSSDNGENWVERGMTGKYVSAIAADHNFIIAGVYSEGFYISTDKGITWELRNDGLEETPSNIIAIHIYNGNIYATIDNKSIWQRSIVDITGVEAGTGNKIETMELSQNYPNPFNPATTIRYAISEEGEAAIKIYDILGEQIAILLNEFKTPGIYETKWNGDNHAGGIYFYKLSQNNHSYTKKMILLK